MVRGIERFPTVFHGAIREVFGSRAMRVAHQAGKNFIPFQTDNNTRFVTNEALADDHPLIFGAPIAPCLLIAVIGRNDLGEHESVNVGHFSSRFLSGEVEELFERTETPAKKSQMFAFGFGDKTDHNSLADGAQRLQSIAAKFSVPLGLEWFAEDRPVLRDKRTGLIVSDLGFGLNYAETDVAKGRRNCGSRFSFVGVTRTEAIALSYLPISIEKYAYAFAFDNKRGGIEDFVLKEPRL